MQTPHEEDREADQDRAGPMPALFRVRFLRVPFAARVQVKALGARWDRRRGAWYVPRGLDLAAFAAWLVPLDSVLPALAEPRHYLTVPFAERAAAKAAGAVWDADLGAWYASAMADPTQLARWRIADVAAGFEPAPRDAFKQVMVSMGCVLADDHPIMDGNRHRIATVGDAPGEQSGVYIAHLKGVPAGHVKNERTGLESDWPRVSAGDSKQLNERAPTFEPLRHARAMAQAARKGRVHEADKPVIYEATAVRAAQFIAELTPAVRPTAYLVARRVPAYPDVYTDPHNETTYLPVYDGSGKLWAIRTVGVDRSEQFTSDSHTLGCFHAVGGLAALDRAPVIVLAQGYASAVSLTQALGFACVAGFTAGNLPAVAKALSERYPDRPLLVAGDDNRATAQRDGVNVGRVKAIEAARVVGGTAIFADFAPGEQDRDPVRCATFNDMAAESQMGLIGVARVVGAVVERILTALRVGGSLSAVRQAATAPAIGARGTTRG